MKIIEPSVEIMTEIDEKAVYSHLERCGRVCYKSEGKITSESAERFLRTIIKSGHESVLEHQSITVKFICDRGVSHEIVRHRIASYCVTGDTLIRSMCQKKWAVEELYNWQFDDKRKGRLKLINARSVDENTGTIVANHISKITKVGTKPVYLLKTESGRFLKCTADHKIYTPDGYRELSEISVNDYVYANGKELLENPDWLKEFYLEKNHTRKETADFIGCCEALVYRSFQKYGIRKPIHNYPNRHPGHGVKGMFSEEVKRKIGESKKGELNPGYKQNRDDLSISGGYDEAHRKYEKTVCVLCGSTEGLELHHINKNPKDNSEDNVITLCSRCHHLWHRPGAIGIFKDKVVSIEYAGEETVYDVSMEAPYFNFVADGIVVHNCQESQRYCNYGKSREVTFIKPLFEPGTQAYREWECACKVAENEYLVLLAMSRKPEEARAVLNNSVKTELVMTANIREWRHFLRLRCAKAAHPQMRQVAMMLLEQMHEKLPVLFEDVYVEINN